MDAITTTEVLVFLSVVAVLYTFWMMYFILAESRRNRKRPKPDNKVSPPDKNSKEDIVGKSRFVLPLYGQPMPKAAVESETESDKKKENIFVPENVPEHPRQVATDELDEVFGAVPEGEDNKPLDIDYPLYVEPFPEEEAAERDDENEDEDEDLPLVGSLSARGASFDQLGDAYRQVVHNPSITEEEKEDTGRILLSLRHTDMFEAIVSGFPEREDKVTTLIDAYLSAFHKRTAQGSAQSPSVQGDLPEGFTVRDYV